jgi:hypothetical protein
MPKRQPLEAPAPEACEVVVAVVVALRRELETERRRRVRAERELDRLTAWIAARLPAPSCIE